MRVLITSLSIILLAASFGCSNRPGPAQGFDARYPKRLKLNDIKFDQVMAKNVYYKRANNPELASITGSWGKGIVGKRPGDIQVVTFFNNGTYLLYQNGDNNVPDSYGVEYGTYNYDISTGTLEVTAIVDENDSVGLANPDEGAGAHKFKWVIRGDTAYIDAGDEKLTLKRIGG